MVTLAEAEVPSANWTVRTKTAPPTNADGLGLAAKIESELPSARAVSMAPVEELSNTLSSEALTPMIQAAVPGLVSQRLVVPLRRRSSRVTVRELLPGSSASWKAPSRAPSGPRIVLLRLTRSRSVPT